MITGQVTTEFMLATLRRLLPPGIVWRQFTIAIDGSYLPWTSFVRATFRGIARAFRDLRNWISDTFLESRVATASRTLPHWFLEYGLPEAGQAMPLDVATQRAMLMAKINARRGQSVARLLMIPAAFGVTEATITEWFDPSRLGVFRLTLPGEVEMFRVDVSEVDVDPLVKTTEKADCIYAQVRRAKPVRTVLELYDDYPEA